MNDEKLLRLIAVSNPVPDAATLHPAPGDEVALLLAIYRRSGIMTATPETTPKAGQPIDEPVIEEPGIGRHAGNHHQAEKTPRRWLRSVAAAAVVIAAVAGVGAWLAASSGNEVDVAEQPAPTSAALASAENLRVAFNQGDFATYRSLFAPGAAVAEGEGWDFLDDIDLDQTAPAPTSSPASFGLQLEAECAADNPTLVRCAWVQSGGVLDRAGIDVRSNVTLFFNEDGAIYNLAAPLASDQGERELITQFYVEFGTWLRATHPDVFEATYITSPDLPQPLENDHIDTLESRAQWATVLDEFLAQSDIYPLGG